jgi:class 3 adenylate cyclase/tetratricopeptide (TPR) repeat protein
VKPLIPHFIQEQFEKGQNFGKFDAFALFLDLSGFTAMTETLLQRGNEGAEILSNILNNIFNPLVETVYAQGGFIPYFAGDAFHAVFPCEKNDLDGKNILALAYNFVQRFGANQYSEEFIIKCKIGVTFGTTEWGIVGASHKGFYFRGTAIERSADCQTKAKAQQIIFDDFLLNKINTDFKYSKLDSALYIFEDTNIAVQTPKNKQILVEINEATGLRFLPKSVIEFNQSGEFRDIVTVFISFEGVKDHDSFNVFATLVLDQIYNFSGYFKEIDFGDKGGVMLAFFGAPLSYENNSQRALEFAESIASEAKNLPDVRVSIGISAGTAYTGIIGGYERAQYAAVGSRVNLAARLMASAEKGTIFTDQEIIKNKNFRFTYEGNIAYKGISKDIATYKLVGRKGEDELSFAGLMVGRQEELQELIQFATPILSNQFAGIVTLFGEAGIGKSRMAFEFKKALYDKGVQNVIICQADQILKKPFNPFIYALKNYFEQSGDKSQAENKKAFEVNFEALLTDCLSETRNEADAIIRELMRTKSILTSLVGLVEDENSLWSQLDAKGRYENTLAAISNFFLAEAMLHPLVIEMEDGHWLDNDSLNFLPNFIEKIQQFPVAILITSRYNDDGSKPIFVGKDLQKTVVYQEIDLNILKIEALEAMAELRLGGQIDATFLEFLHRACNGNPFYAEQMLEYFSETALLEKTAQNVWTVKEKTMKLSSSINAVLMARVDRLSYLVKETVKAAAVIGREFEIPVLSEVMKNQVDFIKRNGNQHLLLKEQIQTAERSQIWWAMNELRYIFKHSLLREAIYDMQLRARLRELHKMIAEAIEKIYSDNIEERYADLAFHYEQAEEDALTVDYLEKAASFAKRNYQNRQALEYYEKLQLYYEEDNNTVELIKLLLKKGEVEQLLGVWHEAEATFTTALMRTSVFDDEMLSARAHNALGSLLMLKGDYASAKKYFEEGLLVFEKHNDAVGLSKSYGNLGNLNFRQGNYAIAEQNFLQCLEIIRTVDEQLINSQIIANLGLTYMNLNNYDEGIRSIQSFLSIAERRNDRLGLASLHTNLGIIFFEKGDYDAALLHYKSGLAISEELGNKLLISIAVGCIGSVYERKGDFAQAYTHFEEDLKLTQSLGDKQGIAIAYGLLGGHYSIKGEFQKALTYLEPNLKLCEELGYQKGVIKALNSLGDVYYFQGEAQKAIMYYEKSIAVAKKINNRLLYGMGMIEKCYALLSLEKIAEVTPLLLDIEKLLQDVPNREFQFEYLILSAAHHREQNVAAKAEAILQRAMQIPNLSTEEETAIYFEFALLFPQTTSWKPRVIARYQSLYAATPKFLYLYKIGLLETLEEK